MEKVHSIDVGDEIYDIVVEDVIRQSAGLKG